MKTYSIAKAKASLSALLKEAAEGYDVIITDHNKPVAKLVSLNLSTALPKTDLRKLLKNLPLLQKRGALSAAELVRKMRDEGY